MTRGRYCSWNGKRRYPTHTIALIALINVVFDVNGQRGARTKVPCRTYQCPLCRAWHLTSEPWEDSLEYRLTLVPQRVDSTSVSRIPQQKRKQNHGTH